MWNEENKCGCGRPVRYSIPSDPEGGSCNKHFRCPSYDDLQSMLREANQRALHYQQIVNLISKYFEDASVMQGDIQRIINMLRRDEL